MNGLFHLEIQARTDRLRIKPVFLVLFQDDLVTSGSLYADQAEQIKREQMELEEKMSRDLAQQRAQQTALLKEKLAQRKRERMKKLKEQQELEKAKVKYTVLYVIRGYTYFHVLATFQ